MSDDKFKANVNKDRAEVRVKAVSAWGGKLRDSVELDQGDKDCPGQVLRRERRIHVLGGRKGQYWVSCQVESYFVHVAQFKRCQRRSFKSSMVDD